MADTHLIRNANDNAQNAVETANKAMDCVKELAPSVGAHEAQIATLVQTCQALSHFLFDAELALIDVLQSMGKPLTEHQRQVLEMSEKLQENAPAPQEPDPNAPRQLAFHIVSDAGDE